MPYTSLKSFSRKELKEIVRELQEELKYHEKTINSFYDENLLLKQQCYNLTKRAEFSEKLKDKVLNVLATNQTLPLQVVTQIREAIGVATE